MHMYASFLLLIVNVHCIRATFNFTKCPGPLELQTSAVRQSFDPALMTGVYYETVFHDYTQSACFVPGGPRCIRSVKQYLPEAKQITDHFTLQCEGRTYPSEFYFNLTSVPGFFHSNVKDIAQPYPDTVVATGPVQKGSKDQYQYSWVIEFQCLAEPQRVVFVGINFYVITPQPSQQVMNTMMATAEAQGIDFYLNQSMTYVNQTGCTYP